MRRTWIILAAAVVLLGALLWWWVAAGGPEPADPAAPTRSAAEGGPAPEPDGTAEGTVPALDADPDADRGTDQDADQDADQGAEPPPDPAPTADPTAPPVGLDDPAELGAVTARLARIEAIQGEADGPGEVAGPALRVAVELTNAGAEAADLTGVVVNLFHGPQESPAEMLAGSGSAWFSGSLAPGATATGVYVFTVPVDDRDPVRVTVFLTVDEPTVLFEGAAG